MSSQTHMLIILLGCNEKLVVESITQSLVNIYSYLMKIKQ